MKNFLQDMKNFLRYAVSLVVIGSISPGWIEFSSAAPQPQKLLSVATVKSMQVGDIMCYVTLLDKNKHEHSVGATFEICEQEKKFLHKKVRLSYKQLAVNDCQSNEPCGKTRLEWLIVKMRING